MDPISSSNSLMVLQQLSIEALKQSMDAAELALTVQSGDSALASEVAASEGLGQNLDIRA